MPPNNGALPNPFKPAAEATPYIKSLLYGLWGSGKTWFSLTAPGPIAVFDTEGGTVPFASKFKFDRIGSKSYRDLIAAIDYIEKNPGSYSTLVIDPVTVIYETLQEAALKAAVARKQRKAGGQSFDPESVDLEMLDWGKIKRNYKALMTRLVNLPCHVVVIARQKDDVVFDARSGESSKRGVVPDAEKSTPYFFDAVIRTASSPSGDARVFMVEKARGIVGDVLPLGSKHTDPTFDTLFGPVLKAAKAAGKKAGEPAAPKVADDEEAASKDAESFGEKVAGPVLAAELVTALEAAGYDAETVRLQKGWPAFADLPEATAQDALAKLTAAAAKANSNGSSAAAEATEAAATTEPGPEAAAAESAPAEAAGAAA